MLFFLLFGLFSEIISAQIIPKTFGFERIATDRTGVLMRETDLIVELAIHKGNAEGTVVYREFHNVKTDKFGIYFIEIGKGTSVYQEVSFDDIRWTDDDFFIETSVDYGDSDVLNGIVQIRTIPLLSTPYSLFSAHALLTDSISKLPFFKMNDIADVSISQISDGQVLTWFDAEKIWKPTDPGSGPSKFLRADGSIDLTSDWIINEHNINLINGTLNTAHFQLNNGFSVNHISDDSTFSNVIRTSLPTQYAVKYYVDSLTKQTWWTGDASKIWLANLNVDFGIGTNSPKFKLHIVGQSEDAFVFEAPFGGAAPVHGAGTRMAFYPAKAAFRAGRVSENPTAWDDTNLGIYSAAFGQDTKVNGSYSFASGKNNAISGSYSVSFGSDNTISNSYAGASGLSNTVSGIYSFAVGRQNTTTATASSVFGYLNEAKGENSLCFGNESRTGSTANSGGTNSISGGYKVYTEGDNSAGFGSGNTSKAAQTVVSGENNYIGAGASGAFVGGYSNEAYGKYSVVFGSENKASSYTQAVFGRFNHQIGTNYDSWFATDALFVLGNGDSESLRSNAFVVLKNGKTGIGVGQNSPSYMLEVGKAGDGSQAIANAWLVYSDERLKTNILPVELTESQILGVNSYHYNFRADDTKHTDFGFLAQEVEQQFPNLVYENSEGVKAIDYVKFVPILWQINKTQSTEIQALKNQLNDISKRLDEIENQR